MTRRNGNSRNSRSVSLTGALAVTMAIGLLLGFVKFAYVWSFWTPLTRIPVFVAIIAMAVWGGKKLLQGESVSARTAHPGRERRRVMLPVPGIAYIAIMIVMFIGSLVGRSNRLMLVFAMMAGPFVINGWVMFVMLRRSKVSRRAPSSVMAGETISIELTVANDKRRLTSRLMEIRDQIAGGDTELSASILFSSIPPRSSRSDVYRLKLMQRGRYVLGPLTLCTRFPMGLVERSIVFDRPAELIVYPRIGRLAPNWDRAYARSAELTWRRTSQRGSFDDEFHHLREYRWGDNPRSIHWRTSARRNELMVREFHENREPDLALLLDLWQPSQPAEEDRERIEFAVSFAATVCVEQLRQCSDSVLELEIAGREFARWSSRQGEAAMESLLAEFALAEATASPDLNRLFETGTVSRRPNLRTVLLTTRPREDASFAALRAAMESGENQTSSVQLVEVDPDELAGVFHLEMDAEGR